MRGEMEGSGVAAFVFLAALSGCAETSGDAQQMVDTKAILAAHTAPQADPQAAFLARQQGALAHVNAQIDAIHIQDTARLAAARETEHARQAAEQTQAAERDEKARLIAKVTTWQPRGNQGAGEGLEGFSDADLDAVPADAAAAIPRLIELGAKETASCSGACAPSSVQGLADHRDQAIAEIRGFVANEKACRADTKCMAARAAKKAEAMFWSSVVVPLCQADKGKEDASALMARERANPSGYVDKVYLYDLGQQVQTDQERMIEMRSKYVAFRHHPWTGWRVECPGGISYQITPSTPPPRAMPK